jgi:hypothetical protein
VVWLLMMSWFPIELVLVLVLVVPLRGHLDLRQADRSSLLG